MMTIEATNRRSRVAGRTRRMAVGVVAVLVVGCSPSDPPVEPPPYVPRGQILEIAGGPQWGPVASAPIPADSMPFSVYATAIRERDGFLYVRDHNKIVRIDPNTSTAQRVAGLGHTVDGIELGTPLNDLLDPAAAGAGNAFLDWSRSFDLGPDGDFYVDAVGAGPFLPASEGRRIFRIDSVTERFHWSLAMARPVRASSGDPPPPAPSTVFRCFESTPVGPFGSTTTHIRIGTIRARSGAAGSTR